MATLPESERPTLYIIHDNPEWIPPFARALADADVPFVEWLLPGATIDLSAAPPEGVFWSRLSASSHTRTDAHVKDYGRAVLAWLEAAGRTVVNGAGVYEIEVSKVRQHRLLENHGFSVPRTAAVFGSEGLAAAARAFTPPFLTKHNQGGKGLGVRRFDSHAELEAAADDFAPDGANAPIDGITLIQEYVPPSQPYITRAEFIGGAFHYAVKVDVSGGSFELCPAEACEVPQPGLASGACDLTAPFSRRDDVTSATPLIRGLEAFLTEQGIAIAGVEFIEKADGTAVVYDVNTNTNYNPDVESLEAAAGREPAAAAIARYLKGLAETAPSAAASLRSPA